MRQLSSEPIVRGQFFLEGGEQMSVGNFPGGEFSSRVITLLGNCLRAIVRETIMQGVIVRALIIRGQFSWRAIIWTPLKTKTSISLNKKSITNIIVRNELVEYNLNLVSGQLPLRKIAPRLGLGFGLGLVLVLWGNFPRGNCPRIFKF